MIQREDRSSPAMPQLIFQVRWTTIKQAHENLCRTSSASIDKEARQWQTDLLRLALSNRPKATLSRAILAMTLIQLHSAGDVSVTEVTGRFQEISSLAHRLETVAKRLGH